MLVTEIRKTIKLVKGRSATRRGEFAVAYGYFYPLLEQTLCVDNKTGNKAIDAIADMYHDMGIETEIDAIGELHERYFSIEKDNSDHTQVVHDKRTLRMLERVTTQCHELLATLPDPGRQKKRRQRPPQRARRRRQPEDDRDA